MTDYKHFRKDAISLTGMQDPDLVMGGVDDLRWNAPQGRRSSATRQARNFGLPELIELMTPKALHNDAMRELGARALDGESIPEAS